MMANYLASNEFTFVHPSAALLVGAPSTSVGYNLDFHGQQQNVFSPINCTLPTTIQFPTPPVTSLPQNGSGLGPCLTETAIGTASSYNFACVTWQPPVNLNPQPLLSTCTEVSLPFVPQVSTIPMPNMSLGATSLWADKLSNCTPPQVGGCKRKAEDPPEDCWLPTKVRINEERMSSCMSHLHLDNNNSGAQPNFESEPWYSQDIKTDASELEELESADFVPESSAASSVDVNLKLALNKNSKLELCRELELGLKTKEILPKVILDELVKSSMQVVLWKPPELFGQQLLPEISGETYKPEQVENLSVEEDEMASEMSVSNLPMLKSCQDLMTTCQPWAVLSETSSLTTDPIDLLDDCEDMDL